MLCCQLDSSSQEKRDQLYKKSVKNRYLVPKVASARRSGDVALYCGESYVYHRSEFNPTRPSIRRLCVSVLVPVRACACLCVCLQLAAWGGEARGATQGRHRFQKLSDPSGRDAPLQSLNDGRKASSATCDCGRQQQNELWWAESAVQIRPETQFRSQSADTFSLLLKPDDLNPMNPYPPPPLPTTGKLFDSERSLLDKALKLDDKKGHSKDQSSDAVPVKGMVKMESSVLQTALEVVS